MPFPNEKWWKPHRSLEMQCLVVHSVMADFGQCLFGVAPPFGVPLPSGPSPFGAPLFGAPPLGPHPLWPPPFGPTPSGPHLLWVWAPFGPPLFLVWAPHPLGPHPSGPHPSGLHHDTHQIGQTDWPKMNWPKIGLVQIGQIWMAKNGLAKVGLSRCIQGALAPESQDADKETERVVCQWDGALRYKWDGAEKEHGRKIKREGEPLSPCIACRGLWLGLPFERVFSLADGWMGVGTWGWCSVQINIRQHERHEDVSRNERGGTSDAVAIFHSQGRWRRLAGCTARCDLEQFLPQCLNFSGTF